MDRFSPERARQLLEDDLLVALVSEAEAIAVEKLVFASLGDALALQSLTAELQAVRNFRSRLQSLATKAAGENITFGTA